MCARRGRAPAISAILLAELLDFAAKRPDAFPQFLGLRKLLGHSSRLGVPRGRACCELVGHLVELTRHLLLRARLLTSVLPTAHGVGRLLHPLGEPLPLQFARGIGGSGLGFLAALPAFRIPVRCRGRPALLQPILQTPNAVGQTVLLACEAPRLVVAGFALAGFRELGRNLPLGIGQLPRFQLHLAERAFLVVHGAGRGLLHLTFELLQLLERFAPAHARLRGILAPQIARRIAHLIGDVAHPLDRFAGSGTTAVAAFGLTLLT